MVSFFYYPNGYPSSRVWPVVVVIVVVVIDLLNNMFVCNQLVYGCKERYSILKLQTMFNFLDKVYGIGRILCRHQGTKTLSLPIL